MTTQNSYWYHCRVDYKCGFERLGKLRRTHGGWIATRNGQPILVWKHSDDAISRCARALAELADNLNRTGGESGND